MRDMVERQVGTAPGRWTPGAVSYALKRPVTGVLGTDPHPDVAAALAELEAVGSVHLIGACPVCGTPGALVVAGPPLAGEPTPDGDEEERASVEAAAAAGTLEVSEIIELAPARCCVRTIRARRRTPPPL